MPPNDESHALLLGLRRSGLIPSGCRVLVAVSGGPDSTALLAAIREEGYELAAAHYDHALRTGSEVVAEHVLGLCEKLGVELLSERRHVAIPSGSIQAAARSLRYDFLDRARASSGADVVAIAHTADDLVEGAVLHLMRGCGLAGLRGMPASRPPFVRPLLHVWRREVIDYLAKRGIAALEDPANTDPAYTRVRVRREILPALERDRPGIGRRFYAAAVRAAAIHESIAGEAAAALDHPTISRSSIANLPKPVALEVMRMLYAKVAGVQPALSRSQLTSMLRLTMSPVGGRGLDLPGGLRFRIVGEVMEVVASASGSRSRPNISLDVTRCRGCDVRETAHLRPELDLHVGFRRPGLRMRPLGGPGTRKLQDIFVDARVPREERDAWPLVFAGERLAWIPGIAVDADLVSRPGELALHAAVMPFPELPRRKSPVLESPDSPPGEPT